MTQTTARKPRLRAREPQTQTVLKDDAATTCVLKDDAATTCVLPTPPAKTPSRLDQLQDLLRREGGATIAEMVEATGWQQHSVRGSMAGALRKRGLIITSQKTAGLRRYCAEQPA